MSKQKAVIRTCHTCREVLTKRNCAPSVFKSGLGYCRVCDNARSKGRSRADDMRYHRRKITSEEVQQELKRQNNRCSICCVVFSFEKKRAGRPHQDHDHKTGKNRELLCMACNILLGCAKDNTEILASAIRYLQKHADSSMIKTFSCENGAG